MNLLRLILISICFSLMAANAAHADNKITDDAYASYNAHTKEMATYFDQFSKQNATDACQTLNKIINSIKLISVDLDVIAKNTQSVSTRENANTEAAKMASYKVQFENKYNNECSPAILEKEARIARRNEYVAAYNRHLKDANDYRKEAFDILQRNGTQSNLCSAFRSERESLYNAHSALYKTFGLVPELDYRGEATIKDLEKKFDQNKLDIDAEGC